MPSRIFECSRLSGDSVVICSAHNVRRSAANASRNDGVAFFGYQGLGVYVDVVPDVVMCQVQMAL
jgi:hypothetical protein